MRAAAPSGRESSSAADDRRPAGGHWFSAGRRWRHSIRGRLVALFVLLALGTSAVFLVGMQRVLHGGWQVWVQPLMADYLDRLAAELGTPPDLQRAQALTERLPIALRIEGPVAAWESHPGRRWHGGPDNWGLVRATADGHRITFALRSMPDSARPRLFGWVTLSLLLLLTLLAWWTVRRQLAPLQGIGDGVEAFGRGDFAARIAVRRDDELGELARRINGMADNLSGMLEAKRALLLAISHELRSPLTRARINTELLPDSAERGALLRDLGEMRDLITGLLESERLAQGHAALHAEHTDLAALVHELVQSQFSDATLRLDVAPMSALADPVRLKLLLRNLVTNALRHGVGAAEPPTVFLRHEADHRIALGVRDHGAGLAPQQIAQLGQAFYRPDEARTRGAGGVGLGLYLCRLVAQAHGGELRIRDAAPGLEVAAVWSPR